MAFQHHLNELSKKLQILKKSHRIIILLRIGSSGIFTLKLQKLMS